MTSCGGGGGDDEGDDDEGDADGEDVPRRIEPGGGEWITVKSRMNGSSTPIPCNKRDFSQQKLALVIIHS